ncbi:Periplasmic immunogenic protein [Minicystis rosea]|nr:Periplasmic immunogenic protein [Minicystis rosea]
MNGEPRFVGYAAHVGFEIILRDLDRVEQILVGVVAAGANEISSVDFQTTKLREHRTEARQQAVSAAREKAKVYCDAAGVMLGRVLHIEDVNPESLTGMREGHAQNKVSVADDEALTISALDPSSIVIAAAVLVVYALQHDA